MSMEKNERAILKLSQLGFLALIIWLAAGTTISSSPEPTRRVARARAATGSSRYSFSSSSLMGTEAQKYENVLLSGIMASRNCSANCPTLTFTGSGRADMLDSITLILSCSGFKALARYTK